MFETGMKKCWFWVWVILLLVMWSMPQKAGAQEESALEGLGAEEQTAEDQALADEEIDLLSMSFEDLMNVEVSVASKKAEKVHEAPGIITVITSKELEAFGGKHLGDVLNRAPSMYFLGADLFFENEAIIRGQTLNQYDTHTLILLNGRPCRDNVAGGVNNPMYLGIPVEAIEHIEIIRGPGSVLYGTNAYAGVINIVTKKAEGMTGGRVAATVGSHNYRAESVQGWFDLGELNGFVTIKNVNEEGPYWSWVDFNGERGGTYMGKHLNTVMANINYKQFSLNAYATENDPTWIDEWAVGDTRNDAPHYFMDLGFTQPLTENLTTNFNITFNRHKIGKIGMPT